MKLLGVDKFKFEVIDTVEYIDNETLLIMESVTMDKYNSIESEYNVEHSVDLQNYFKLILIIYILCDIYIYIFSIIL